MSWIAVRTKSGSETYARRNVERVGHETYLPFHQDFFTRQIEPLFPRYLFVRKSHHWWNLRTTWGVLCVVRRGEDPDEMSDEVVDGLRSREDERGLVRLDQPNYRPGCKVRAVGGGMIGQLGIYRGMSRRDRCEVLYDMLGSTRAVSVPMEYLRLAN